jgi:thioredoxin reductase (NADPH)
VRKNAIVTSVDLERKVVTLEDRSTYSARAIIIATGVRRRQLGVPGEIEFQGRGVLNSGVESKTEVAGKKVVIVGGGDAAIENALLLGENAKGVIVIHRRKEFASRPEFLDKARAISTIEFLTESEVRAIKGTQGVTSVEIVSVLNGTKREIETDAVLVRIGVSPNTEMFRGQIELDPKGYIEIDHSSAASLSGIFAAGDVSNPMSPTVSTAIGSGASAAKAARALISALDRA